MTLAEYEVRGREILVTLDSPATIELLGPGCQLLEREQAGEARFLVPERLPYVRVRVTAGVKHAWLQPIFC